MVVVEFKRIRCPVCKQFYKNKDIVILNEFYTLIHMNCSYDELGYVLDRGTYRSMLEKYDVFKDLRGV